MKYNIPNGATRYWKAQMLAPLMGHMAISEGDYEIGCNRTMVGQPCCVIMEKYKLLQEVKNIVQFNIDGALMSLEDDCIYSKLLQMCVRKPEMVGNKDLGITYVVKRGRVTEAKVNIDDFAVKKMRVYNQVLEEEEKRKIDEEALGLNWEEEESVEEEMEKKMPAKEGTKIQGMEMLKYKENIKRVYVVNDSSIDNKED
jgi:hypothetical protein